MIRWEVPVGAAPRSATGVLLEAGGAAYGIHFRICGARDRPAVVPYLLRQLGFAPDRLLSGCVMQFLLFGLAFVGLVFLLYLVATIGFGVWAVKEITPLIPEITGYSECVQTALQNQVRSYQSALEDAYKRGEMLRPPSEQDMLDRARQACK